MQIYLILIVLRNTSKMEFETLSRDQSPNVPILCNSCKTIGENSSCWYICQSQKPCPNPVPCLCAADNVVHVLLLSSEVHRHILSLFLGPCVAFYFSQREVLVMPCFWHISNMFFRKFYFILVRGFVETIWEVEAMIIQHLLSTDYWGISKFPWRFLKHFWAKPYW